MKEYPSPHEPLYQRINDRINDNHEICFLTGMLGMSEEETARFTSRVHGVHKRLYWLLWRKKNENLGIFGKVVFEIVIKEKP